MCNEQKGMNTYRFVLQLEGSVCAKDRKEANAKMNGHLDDLGEIESLIKYDLHWGDCSWELELEEER
jgi:hypothetical protein